MRPKTVLSPVAIHMPVAVPETQCVPWRPMHRVSRKFLSVDSTVPSTGSDSPKRS